MIIAAPSCQLLIDFGLAYTSTLVEDKAVDLYVLERAFASTHPESEPMFTRVLEAYARQLGKKHWEKVENRLKDGLLSPAAFYIWESLLTSSFPVRLRGRKRSMVG
jgi:TP53 regulating kinase and related kinases